MKTGCVICLTMAFLASPIVHPVIAEEVVSVREAVREIETALHRDVVPIIERYCADCHAEGISSGGLTLEPTASLEEQLSELDAWGKAARTQRLLQMPPEDADQPSAAQRKILIDWVPAAERTLAEVEPFDPGRIVFRRLTREHYQRTVQDLFGLEYDIASAVGLNRDPEAFGYDSIATVLEIPPTQMAKYSAAADELLDRVIAETAIDKTWTAAEMPFVEQGKMPERPGKDGKIPPASEKQKGSWLLRVKSTSTFPVDIPEAGMYRLEVRGYAYNAVHWQTYTADIALEVGGTQRKVLSLIAKDNDKKTPERKTETTQSLLYLPAGETELGLAYLNPVHGPHWSDTRYKYLVIEQARLVGSVPASGAQVDQQAHQRIFFAEPDTDDAQQSRQAARKIIEKFASRAFRRPPSDEEIDRLMTLYNRSREQGTGFQRAVRPMLKAVLLSPYFLFRIESDSGAGDVHPINDHELATRLSYFLWGTMPDDELRQLADEGKLNDPRVLRQQSMRMLSDERAKQFSDDFAAQWLHLDELETALPSEDRFPDFTAELRHSMRMEVLLFFQNLVANNRPVTELIESDYTFMDRRLSGLYRMGRFPERGVFREESIDRRRRERGGLLGMAGILAMTSHVDRNSPTRRGKWVLDVMLGDPPPPPPANVEQIDAAGDKSQAKSFRELLAIHADETSSCAGCHRKMDPLGFALDNFNPIGRWEVERDGSKINATGKLPDGREVKGVVELRELLMSQKDQFAENLTEQMLIYALGRDLDYYDRPTVARIVQRLRGSDYRMHELILGVVESYPFQHRRSSNAGSVLSMNPIESTTPPE